MSQAVFAGYLNLTVGYVSQLERGTKRPTGAALTLLNIIKRKGIEAILRSGIKALPMGSNPVFSAVRAVLADASAHVATGAAFARTRIVPIIRKFGSSGRCVT
jgi:transcriptional regulator with XRE-family HTH domain